MSYVPSSLVPSFAPDHDLLSGSRIRSRPDLRAVLVIAGTLAVLFMLALASVLVVNEGHFTYALDPATYTHLAVAQQILHGGYGVFAGEASAPSSSILFPYLIALVSWLGFGQLAPLAINVVSVLLLAPVLCGIAAECGWRLERVPAAGLAAVTAALALALNLVGLAFTGLEHPTHILLTVLCQWGLLRFLQRERTDWWWLAAIVCLPLIRYEALAAVLADVVVLLLFRKFLYAAVVALLGSALVAGFGVYLHSLGMSYLPTSVLFNSEVATGGLGLADQGIFTFARTLAVSLRNNVLSFGATHILALLVVVCWSLRGWRREPLRRRADWVTPTAVMFCVIVTVAQLSAGSLQSRSARYETYVLFLELCTILICYRQRLAAITAGLAPRSVAFVSLSILVFGAGYVVHTLDLPGASRVIYAGPYQIRRFVVEYHKAPIASSYYGLINNDNPYHVLDLSGRISEEARRGRMGDADPRWMERLVSDKAVGLVILSSGDKALASARWVALGTLATANTSVFIPPVVATFYATDPREKEKLVAQLKAFGQTLPAGAMLSVY